MKKQLITDQLIEKYENDLQITYQKLDLYKQKTADRNENYIRLETTRNDLLTIIYDLRHLRQQEVQNVIDAHFAGIRRLTNDPAKASTDYFTQTFEQKGGGKK